METDIDMGQTKPRVIFVDDDVMLINGLRCMLMDMQDEWEMHFANSGKQALELMEQHQFDVIVSDMRMPVMSGAALLKEVKRLYPQMIRFILSGYSEEKMVLETISATDQFLNKPCNEDELKTSIRESLEARRIFNNNQVSEVITQMKYLPTMPELYLKLKRLLGDPNSSLKEISEMISLDISIAAKVLQLVNSAFFGLRHRIVDIHQATVYLGIKTIKAVIIMADVFAEFTEEEIEIFRIDRLYHHCIVVGNISRVIAADISDKLVDSASMAGLLHDIGKIVLIRNYFDKYKDCYVNSAEIKKPVWMLEQNFVGIKHADVGGYLMSIWGIPSDIVRAILFHHKYSEAGESLSLDNIVQIANILYHIAISDDAAAEDISYYYKSLKCFDLPDAQLQEWQEKAKEIVMNTENYFGFLK